MSGKCQIHATCFLSLDGSKVGSDIVASHLRNARVHETLFMRFSKGKKDPHWQKRELRVSGPASIPEVRLQHQTVVYC